MFQARMKPTPHLIRQVSTSELNEQVVSYVPSEDVPAYITKVSRQAVNQMGLEYGIITHTAYVPLTAQISVGDRLGGLKVLDITDTRNCRAVDLTEVDSDEQ